MKLSIVLILVTSLFYNPRPVQNNLNTEIIDTSQYTILVYDSTYTYYFADAKATSLSIDEIKSVETLLSLSVDTHNRNPGIRERIDSLHTYKRQYLPVLNQKNEKEVFINCFCNPKRVFGNKTLLLDNRWRKELAFVDGGGSCYFNVIVNLTLTNYRRFNVNGPK